MSDMASVVDPMLDALLKSMPKQLAEEARGVHNLFILTGCTAASAKRKGGRALQPAEGHEGDWEVPEPVGGFNLRPHRR